MVKNLIRALRPILSVDLTAPETDSLTGTDSTNSNNSVTAEGTQELYVLVNANGNATVKFSDSAIAASDGDTDDVLWRVLQGNTTIGSGTFSSGATITLNPATQGTEFIAEAGVDMSGNDKLEEPEVTETIRIHLTHFGGITAFRTDGKFGQAVTRAIQQTNDPTKYVVLVNDNFDQTLDQSQADNALPTAPIQNDQMQLDQNGNPLDPDFGHITLHQLPQGFIGGTVTLLLSDPSAVKLFDKNGQALTSGDLTLNLSNPSGYLAGLLSGDVDIWFEGMHTSPDFSFTISYNEPAVSQYSQDVVHLLIADWQFVGSDGNRLTNDVSTVSEETLTDEANGNLDSPTIPNEDKFKVLLDGLPSTALQSLQFNSISGPTDSFLDTFSGTSSSTSSNNFTVMYGVPDGLSQFSTSQRSSILSALGVNAIAANTVRVIAQLANDVLQQEIKADPMRVTFVSGEDPTDGTIETRRSIDNNEPFYMKGYMLELEVNNKVGTQVQWSFQKIGHGNQDFGAFYDGHDWVDYADNHKLNAKPTDGLVNWRSDFDANGDINDEYSITAKYTKPDGTPGFSTLHLKSRLLDPNDPNASAKYHTDADMAQRALIQDFGLDKGRLSSYRIGQYDKGSQNGWYVSSRQMNVRQWSAIADEVSNFRHFALNKAFDPTLLLDTVTGIWNEFSKILAAPLPNKVDQNNAQFGNWITQALTASGLTAPNGASVTSEQILRALITHESGGTHSYDLQAPLAANYIQVGTQNNGAGANLHQLTDWGLGFAKVQPYNDNGLNLYDPYQNILRGAQMFAAALANQGINEVGDNRIWMAYYYYNSGHIENGSIDGAGGARAVNRFGAADHADAFFSALGLQPPQ